jgi:hypothetical protein
MKMYYYIKPSYGQDVLKSSQEYGKSAAEAGVNPENKEWRYLSTEGRVEKVNSNSEVDGSLVMEMIKGGYEPESEGKYSIVVRDDDGNLLKLPGRYKYKSAATRMLPGLSMYYDFVAVLGDNVKPWVSRADINAQIYDDISF